MKTKYLVSLALLFNAALSLSGSRALTIEDAPKYAAQLVRYARQLDTIHRLINKNNISLKSLTKATKELEEQEDVLTAYADKNVYQAEFQRNAPVIEVFGAENVLVDEIVLGIIPILVDYVINSSYPEGIDKKDVMERINKQKDAVKLKIEEFIAVYNL